MSSLIMLEERNNVVIFSNVKGLVRGWYDKCLKTNLLTVAANYDVLSTYVRQQLQINETFCANLGRRSSPFFRQILVKRRAAIKRQQNKDVASFSPRMTSEKHRFFVFMMSLPSCRLFELRDFAENRRKMAGKSTVYNS